MFPLTDIFNVGMKILDKFIPDPEAKAKAQQELIKMQQEGRLAELNADNVEAQELTKRQQADMISDSWLSKNIRPMTLIFILFAYFLFAMMSAFGNNANEKYVELLGQYNGRYFASYSYLEADGTPSSGTFIFDLSGQTPFVLRGTAKADACWYDIEGSQLYMLMGNQVFEWDAFGQINEVMTWLSKEFVLAAPASFGCIYIDSQRQRTPEQQAAIDAEIETIKARNAATFAAGSMGGDLNGSAINVHQVNGDDLTRLSPQSFIVVSVYADGALICTVSTANQVVRIPPVRARRWEVRVNGTLEVAEIALASTARELNTV